jgi:hypothetical protein
VAVGDTAELIQTIVSLRQAVRSLANGAADTRAAAVIPRSGLTTADGELTGVVPAGRCELPVRG